MRTTLTLDDDLLARLKKLAARQEVSLKEVVNAVLRRGLGAPESRPEVPTSFEVVTFDSPLRAGVDAQRLNQLADDLEVEHRTSRSS